jgi:predicted MFS family arabinose efflux permease
MSFRRLRVGELLAVAGAGCVIASLFVSWYESPVGALDAWDTFGPAVALLLAAALVALVLLLSALTERTPALPVAAAVWCVLFGLVAVIAALVRVLERPDHASSLATGAWLALAGALAIFLGAWLAVRDERSSLYEPVAPEPRPRPSGVVEQDPQGRSLESPPS